MWNHLKRGDLIVKGSVFSHTTISFLIETQQRLGRYLNVFIFAGARCSHRETSPIKRPAGDRVNALLLKAWALIDQAKQEEMSWIDLPQGFATVKHEQLNYHCWGLFKVYYRSMFKTSYMYIDRNEDRSEWANCHDHCMFSKTRIINLMKNTVFIGY